MKTIIIDNKIYIINYDSECITLNLVIPSRNIQKMIELTGAKVISKNGNRIKIKVSPFVFDFMDKSPKENCVLIFENKKNISGYTKLSDFKFSNIFKY